MPLVRWLWGLNILHPFQQYRRERVGWNPGTNYRSPTTLHNFFVFLGSIIICRLSKLTLSDQARVTATERQSFRFSVKTCSRSAPVGGFERFIFLFLFHQDPNPLSVGPLLWYRIKTLYNTLLPSYEGLMYPGPSPVSVYWCMLDKIQSSRIFRSSVPCQHIGYP